VATDPSHPAPLNRRSLAELTVRDTHADLLEVQLLDLGPGTPATIALEHVELTRFRGHSSAWAARLGQEGCPHATNPTAVSAGVPPPGG
jgi:hypothetical protein